MTMWFVFSEFKTCSLWWTWNFGGNYKYQSSWKTLFSMSAVYSFVSLYISSRLGSDPTEFSRSEFYSISRANSGEPLDVQFHVKPLWSHQCSSVLKKPPTGLNTSFSSNVFNLLTSIMFKEWFLSLVFPFFFRTTYVFKCNSVWNGVPAGQRTDWRG